MQSFEFLHVTTLVTSLKNVSPNDVYAGRQEEVLNARLEKKRRTLARHKAINLKLEESSGKL
ncbi:MAG: hypothetical protein WC532_09025 [Candidatus Omnitrophota bacterium]